MITTNLENKVSFCYNLKNCWAISCYENDHMCFIVKPDGAWTKYEKISLMSWGSRFNNFIDENGEITEDESKRYNLNNYEINSNFAYEFLSRDTIISRHCGFGKDDHAVILQNKKEEKTIGIIVPKEIIDENNYDSEYDDFGLRASFSTDGLTLLIYQHGNNKILILDNPVLE